MKNREKIAYLKALMYMATIDEELDENEKDYLLGIAEIYGMDEQTARELLESVINKEETLKEILEAIEERQTKLLLIYELIALSYEDGEFSEEEEEALIEMADILGIESDKVYEINQLMLENEELQRKIDVTLER